MSYYRDLDVCTEMVWALSVYGTLDRHTEPAGGPVLAVGWLAAGEPFATGSVPDDLLACLGHQANIASLGFHRCELCVPTANRDELDESQDVPSGSNVFLIPGHGGIIYAAPELIAHYIRDHGYAPPEEFTAALRASYERRRANMRS